MCTTASRATSATRHVRRMRRDALVAGAEDGVPAVEAVQGRAAAAGIALVARRRRVAEVAAPHPLAQVAAHRGHVPQLRRGAQQQRLGDDREPLRRRRAPGRRRSSWPARRCEDRRPAGPRRRFSGRSLMSTSSPGRSTFWRTRSTSVVPPARNAPSACSRTSRDRAVDVGCPRVAERPHRHSPPAASRTSRIAARMFGIGGAAADVAAHPLARSRASSPAWPSSSSATADMIWPGVQ